MPAPKKSKLTALALGLALLGLAVTLAACGAKSEQPVSPGAGQPLSLDLDWYPNADHAGIYTGQALGYFEDAGIDLSIRTPTDPALPIKLVAAGRADLAVTYEPEVILAQQEGLDVIAVGALVNRPLTSMIWLEKSKLKGVAGLAGKTVSTAGIPYQDGYLSTILDRAKVNPDKVRKVNVGEGLLPSILSGKAQATLGPFWNIEGVQLKLDGDHPVVNPVDRLGVPDYDELVLVARGSRVRQDPEPLRLFLGALARGTSAAAAKPNLAAKSVLDANDSLRPKVNRAQVAVTAPILNQRAENRPYGYMDAGEWSRFITWMNQNGLIKGLPLPRQVMTNSLLPSGVPSSG